MSDISQFEQRIMAALERIGRAVALAEERAEQAGAGGGIASDEMEAEIGRLNEALESEKEASAQLEARVKAIHEKQTSHVAELEGEVEGLRRQLADIESAMVSMRHANDTLRSNNAALRDANAAGLGDASLIDAGLKAEMDALQAARATERAALDVLVADLTAALPEDAAGNAGPEGDADATPSETSETEEA